MFLAADYLSLDHCPAEDIFGGVNQVWEAIPKIALWLAENPKKAMRGSVLGAPYIGEDVFIGEGTVIEHGAVIKGPAWIGSNCSIRSGCYIRENVIVGDGAVLGNSSEFKNCLVFDGAEVPHFNYVGDSILGYKAHLGAGVILSNVRLDRQEVSIRTEDAVIQTGLRKFGAIVGDHVEIGCNAVISPGAILGRRSVLYPGIQWRGVLAANQVAGFRQVHTVVPRRD